MTYQLFTLIVIFLHGGTNAIRCFHCMKGYSTFNSQERKIPNECAKPYKTDCDESQTTCIFGDYGVQVITLNGTIQAMAEGKIKDCHDIAMYGSDPCQTLQDKFAVPDDGSTVSAFRCNINTCSTEDYCNTGGEPELTFLMGTFLSLRLLFGQ
ncbi:hypothetical protein ACHWQZ_G014296 [Mnemiopsis leidyi]